MLLGVEGSRSNFNYAYEMYIPNVLDVRGRRMIYSFFLKIMRSFAPRASFRKPPTSYPFAE